MITEQQELTPIETYNNILFKRDDLYVPYTDIPLSGGKVRQCQSLLTPLLDQIKQKHDSTIATCTSVHSPQGIIVATVAHKLGLKSILGVGGKVQFDKHSMLTYCNKNYNTELKILSGIAYNHQLYKELSNYHKQKQFYIVRFGINLETNPEAILGSISNQAENIPTDLDNIVIPAGSGITAAGILLGLKQFNIKPKRVIIHQIAGNDRRKDIRSILHQRLHLLSHTIKFDYVADPTYPYSKELKHIVKDTATNSQFELDPIYEAKTYDWLIKRSNIDTDKERTLFWVVGNSNPIRQFTASI